MAPARLLRLTIILGIYLTSFIHVVFSGNDVGNATSGFNITDVDTAMRALKEVLPNSVTTGKYGPDAIHIGNYTLLGCSSRSAGNKADYMTTMLPTMLGRLRYTIEDTQTSDSSFHGYTAFFKGTNKEIVESVFRNMQLGSPLTLKTTRGDRIESPKIVCLGEEGNAGHVTGIGNLYWYFCTRPHTSQAPTAQFLDSELIVLCPKFFDLPIWSTIQTCPRLVNGDLMPDGAQLLQSQFAMIVRALAGLYIPPSRLNVPSPSTDQPAYVKTVVALPRGAAQRSRDSYAYYAAGEFFQE
ncbi:MAG: hypothetical protein L6R41_000380 [Letrouitia leprolyta]|nr:MAG: hypothetical protein L6R41_000380 [Letrouitia leprolyta]